ncbi:MAG: hypothetical protein ACJAUV_002323 [Flavobacteriales bacterium]
MNFKSKQLKFTGLSKTYQFLLLVMFAAIPLFAIDVFRIKIGALSITISLIILLILFLLSKQRLQTIPKIIWRIIGVVFIFHLVTIFYAYDADLVLKYSLKYLFWIVIFWMSNVVFNNLKKPPLRAFQVMAVCSSLLGIYLIYTSLFTLKVGAIFFEGTGRNQIQVYLVLLMPLLGYLYSKTNKYIYVFSLIINAIVSIFLASRGLWVALALGWGVWFAFSVLKNLSFRRIIFYSILVATITTLSSKIKVGASVWTYVTKRFESIFTINEQINDGHIDSITERASLIKLALNDFYLHPFFGRGLGTFELTNVIGKITHNDYLFFLCSFGIIGLLLFLFFEWKVLQKLNKRGLATLIAPFFIDLTFINAYTFPLFPIFLGLYFSNLFLFEENFRKGRLKKQT